MGCLHRREKESICFVFTSFYTGVVAWGLALVRKVFYH